MEYREFTELELKWIRSFERVMAKAPGNLFMFVGSGIAIFSERKHTDSGNVDANAPGISIQTPMSFDGGDY